MNKIALFLAAILWVTLAAKGQQIEVYVAKGDVQIKQNGKLLPPKEGLVLTENSTVILAEKAQLVLYSGEKAVVLNQPQTYTYKDIVAQFAESKKSITDRYIAYIWNQAHSQTDGDAKKGTSHVAGMVSRGAGGISGFQDSSIVVSASFVVALDDEIFPGKIYVYDRKKLLFNIEVDTTTALILNDDRFSSGKWYGLAASSDGQAPLAGITYFKWATASETEGFYTGLADLSEALQNYPDEVKAEIIAAYIAENRFVFYQNASKK
jgi:hypothetical protein